MSLLRRRGLENKLCAGNWQGIDLVMTTEWGRDFSVDTATDSHRGSSSKCVLK
jgi:hypothetical protein